ncbi:hypothetical protein IMY05_004G0032000 [Salix suchowensis]|nr:hypothetical protein IMY05_004G0032000 [Salix suchowensis]
MACHASCGGNGKKNRSKEEELVELAKEKVCPKWKQHKSNGDGALRVSQDENKNVTEKIGFDLD